jgi:glycosyltransferase involved in cell wall biosynthesis
MKITFLLPGVKISGGIRSTLELANCLLDRGHEVSIVYPLIESLNGRNLHDIRGLAGRIIRGYRSFKLGSRIHWFDLRANLVRVPLISKRWIPKGDTIVATWWANAYDIHRCGDDKGEKFYFIRGYETWAGPEELVRKTYTLPLHKIVTSTWLKTLMKTVFNVEVLGPVANSVNFDLFYREKDDFRCADYKRVGILYRKDKGKGIKDGLEAFRIVYEKYPRVQFVLFGEQPTHEDKKIIDRIGRVEFHKLPYKERLRRIYNSLDIFVFPSHSEGFGNPPMEAMACGVACIATDVGGIPDYTIPGETALVIPPKEPVMLANKIMELLECEDRRQQIAEAGNKYVRQFTWEQSAAKLERIFAEYSHAPSWNENLLIKTQSKG